MSKAKFMATMQALYRVGNYADSDSDQRAPWTKPEMAGNACCQHLDRMLRDLLACGAITQDDVDDFSNTL